jgi:hypothetical protein
MNGAKSFFSILSISTALLGAAAAQRPDLPAGPNRDLVSRTCQACHDLGTVVAASGLSRDGWNSTIDGMITYGLSITPDDRGKIVDYLSTYLGSSAAPAPGGR